MARVTVLGAGGWGIAASNLLIENHHTITIWEYDPQAARALEERRENRDKLPGVLLDPGIVVSNDLGETVADAEVVFFAVPVQTIRGVCEMLNVVRQRARLLVSLSKGIEVQSLQRVSQIFREVLGEKCRQKIVVVSGPSHAEEVSRHLPTSVVAASESAEAALEIQQVMTTPVFRVYWSQDVSGVELGGALKNIIAVAAGIVQGLELGDNTLGALLTRGLAEITRLGIKLGAEAETFAGLSGLGDLVTTCASRHSRNRFVGEQIGRGQALNQVLSTMTMVAEGVETTRAAVLLARRHHVEMPITEQVHQVLFKGKPAAEAVSELMVRELKPEVYH